MKNRTIPGHDKITRPSFRVFLGGEDITLKHGIISILVSNHVNRIPQATVVLHDGNAAKGDFELSGGKKQSFAPGVKMEIKAGYAQTEKTVFAGIIVKHSIKAPLKDNSTLTLELRDESVKHTLVRKTKTFVDKSDSDIIKDVIGATVKAGTTPPTTHKSMTQYDATNWDFALTRAEANGWLAFVKEGKIEINAPEWTNANPTGIKLKLAYGDNIVDFEAEMDARDQYTSVDATAWDPEKLDKVEGSGKKSGLVEHAKSGVSAGDLASVFSAEVKLQHPALMPKTELDSWASARLFRSQLSKISGRVRIYGTNVIFPGDFIELERLGNSFNGYAFVSGVTHSYGARSTWVTDIQFGLPNEQFIDRYQNITDKPAAGLMPAIHGLHIGKVKSLANSKNDETLIEVLIPTLDADGKAVFARLAKPDAGNGRGMVFRPEVDDEVIVGFINDDPRHPIILGTLHGKKNKQPDDLKNEDGKNNKKGFVTKSMMKFLFDEEKKIITIETPGKNKIVIDDDKKSITLEDQNKNKITMDDKGITLDSGKDVIIKAKGDVKVDGANIKQKAKQEFKAEGSTSATLSSSAQAVIKGGIVKIN